MDSIKGPELSIYPVVHKKGSRSPKETVVQLTSVERKKASESIADESIKTLAFLVKEKW